MTKRNTVRCWTWAAFVFLAVTLSGCPVVVPIIDSFKQAGVTAGDRKNLLKPVVQNFHRSMTSGDLDGVLSLVDEEAPTLREALIQEMRTSKRKVTVVDTQVDLTMFEDDAYIAQVDVLVKYFEVPYYVVNRRIEKETCKFSLSGGWKISSRLIENIEE